MKKIMSFWIEVCKEEMWRLSEFSKTQKNLPEFYQQELATLRTLYSSNSVICSMTHRSCYHVHIVQQYECASVACALYTVTVKSNTVRSDWRSR